MKNDNVIFLATYSQQVQNTTKTVDFAYCRRCGFTVKHPESKKTQEEME